MCKKTAKLTSTLLSIVFLITFVSIPVSAVTTNEYTRKAGPTVVVGEEFDLTLDVYCNRRFNNMTLLAHSTDKSVVTATGSIGPITGSGDSYTAHCKAISAGTANVYSSYAGGSISAFAGNTDAKVRITLYEITVLPSTFDVTFDPNGGSCTVTSGKIEYGQPYGYYMQQLPTPTRQGYTFDGWYTAPSGGTLVTSTTVFSNKADPTLYAHWSLATFPVYFDPNGGRTPTEYKYVSYGSAYGELPVPTREGYTFKGWYTRLQYGVTVTEDTIVTESDEHVLYAHWDEVPATPPPAATATPEVSEAPATSPVPTATAAPPATDIPVDEEEPALPTIEPSRTPAPQNTAAPTPEPDDDIHYGEDVPVATPVIPTESPAGITAEIPKISIGSLTVGKTVSLSFTDAEAEIRYTVDGSVPTVSSELYTGPLTVTDTTTIKAVAVKNGSVISRVASGKISVPAVTAAPDDKVSADILFTDRNGNTVTDTDGISDELTANITAYDIQGSDDVSLTVNVILAVYDREGILVSMDIFEPDLSDRNYVFTNTIEIPENVSVGAIKLMIWNGLNDMSPISAAGKLV